MDQLALSLELEEALKLFQLLDWWTPQRLSEETGIKTDRIKYLGKLRKEFRGYDGVLEHGLTPEQLELLDHFSRALSYNESKSLEKILPKKIDGEQFGFIDLFAGIGGIRKPFSDIGGKCLLTCEWDEYAQKTYKANWKSEAGHKFVSDIKAITQPTNRAGKKLAPSTLVKHIDKEVPDHEVLLAGFPCQPFSIAGVSKKNALNRAHGFECEDQGQLFFDICRILLVKQPPIVVLENVKNLKSHDRGNTFTVIQETLRNLPEHQPELLGRKLLNRKRAYWIANRTENNPDPKVVDGKHYLPQHRERVVLVCIRQDIADRLSMEEKIDLRNLERPERRPSLVDILDPNSEVDEKYTLTPKLWDYLYKYAKKHKAKGNGFGYGMVSRNRKDVTRTLSARYYKDGSEVLINQDDMRKDKVRQGRPRRLTPQECARLMGFTSKDDAFNIPVSDTRAYKQFGNSVVVPVFAAVARLLQPSLPSIINCRNEIDSKNTR